MNYQDELEKFGMKIGYESLLVRKDIVTDEKVREKCKVDTSNYGKNYACPPFSPVITQFKKRNIFIYLLYIQGKEIEKWDLLAKLIFDYGKKLEKELAGICLIAGPCKLCKSCKAETAETCPFPQERRYSFTGVGLDTEKLNKILRRKIIWDNRYISAVGGCLTDKEGVDSDKLFSILQGERG
jgi:predicted metal-binding protein